MKPEVVDLVFARLGLRIFERGWLSSNNVLFRRTARAPAALVDTGYASHAAQTVALVAHALEGQPLGLVVNTHLHSDHCGGNPALHERWQCEIVVPSRSVEAVRAWDEHRLTFAATGQRCERFPVHGGVRGGDTMALGSSHWEVHETGGHDPDAVVLFEPREGVLISGDALWRDRVAVVFPELDGEPGFASAFATLELMESLAPRIVIPGHGAPFTEVGEALEQSRRRLEAFAQNPEKHRHHAARVLLVFHLLEHRRRTRAELLDWMARAPLVGRLVPDGDREAWLAEMLERLERDRVVRVEGDHCELLL